MIIFTGKLKIKGNETQVSEKFRKRELVVTSLDTKYPQHVSFQLANDKCSLLDKFNVGNEITVSFNLNGREWKSPQGEIKYFNTLEAWKIEGNAGSQKEPEAKSQETTSQNDDLPF